MSDNSKRSQKWNYLAFWIFGVCNNFVYIIMLTAAQDILNKHKSTTAPIETGNSTHSEHVEQCVPEMQFRECTPHSAGIVLFCNIFPAFIIKASYPLIAYRIPYGVRHTFVCLAQALSLLVVALADSVPVALGGVMLTAISNGMGESTFLALSSHYSKHTISFWASGTGMSGVAGAFAYAGMTDPLLLGLSPTRAMLICLVVPAIFYLTYFFVLQQPSTVKKVSLMKPMSWIGFEAKSASLDLGLESKTQSEPDLTPEPKELSGTGFFPAGKDGSRWNVVKSLLKYMIPLYVVYWAEYFINQGLVELIVFDCAHGFGTSPRSQYRWYQVLYQVGVFISRSSIKIVEMNMFWIALMPLLQLLNAVFFLFNSIHAFVPHFGLVAAVVLYEGLVGGAAYVNSFNHIHKNVDPSIREFALAIVTLADTSGILTAAITAVPAHNAVCAIPHM